MSAAVPNVSTIASTIALAVALTACAGATSGAQAGAPPTAAGRLPTDDPSATLLPAGFGTLRQDDVALRVGLVGGVTVRLIPLDEGVIRLLSPDSYRALHDLQAGRSAQLAEIARRFGYQKYSVWYVSFFGSEQGEARFSPQEVIITNAGRDFRPLDIVPLTPGFGEQRLRQRSTQSALYVFDGTLDVNQSQLTVTVETTPDDSWGNVVLPRIERERALVRSRAARGAGPAAAKSVPPAPGSRPLD
ncbi:MAG: hypothetical protein JO180_04610 [Gemmatirosa sp.]|nr:hypothetical protein [Gemmatirosa sp.]